MQLSLILAKLRPLAWAFTVMCFGLLAGCANQEIASYQGKKPDLNLKTYFNGNLKAHGVFQDRSGTVVKSFVVDMRCNWVGDVGTLEEDFVYSDGTKDRRVWTLTQTGPNSFVGRADDVIGEANGTTAGNAFNWRYTLLLPVDGKKYEVQFDDWMYQIDEKVMLNRAIMSKFGIRLGEVLLSFTKP